MFLTIDYVLHIYDGDFNNGVNSVIISPDKNALKEDIKTIVEIFFDTLFDAYDDSEVIFYIDALNNVYPPDSHSRTLFVKRSDIENLSRDIVSLLDRFEYISIGIPGNSIDNKKFPELAGNTLNVLEIYKVECDNRRRIYI